MKNINIPVTDSEHESLESVKGDRTWREAFLEEFRVDSDE